MRRKVKRKWIWTVGIIFLILVVVSLILIYELLSYEAIRRIGRVPKIGEFYDLFAYSHYQPVLYPCEGPGPGLNRTCMNTTYVDGVQITLEDTTGTQSPQTHVTKTISYSGTDPYTGEEWYEEVNGFTEFRVIVGNEYLITAEFNNSKKSATCAIGPGEKGFVGMLDVIISENNMVKDIECSIVGFL